MNLYFGNDSSIFLHKYLEKETLFVVELCDRFCSEVKGQWGGLSFHVYGSYSLLASVNVHPAPTRDLRGIRRLSRSRAPRVGAPVPDCVRTGAAERPLCTRRAVPPRLSPG